MILTPFSRSHEDLNCWKTLKNGLSAPCLLKEHMDFDHTCTSRLLGHVKEQGPVVQSVVSLTSSLRLISLTVLADSIYNILIAFAEKFE